MAFKDGGKVVKFTPPPPNTDRPAVGGPKAPENPHVNTYHGTEAPESSTDLQPTPIPAVSQQEAE